MGTSRGKGLLTSTSAIPEAHSKGFRFFGLQPRIAWMPGGVGSGFSQHAVLDVLKIKK
jgi:hypothetical protein